MPAIYLDESGDLGFNFTKPKTSKYFVITCLFVMNSRPAEKIVRRIVKKLPLKERMRHSGVLHAHKETIRNRKRLLTELANQNSNVAVVSVCLNKTKVHTSWQEQKHALYNSLTNILLDRIYEKDILKGGRVDVVASQRETKALLNREFVAFLEAQLNKDQKIKIHVQIKTPIQEKCLQLADFASWSIFRDREHQDDTYKKIIKDVIVEEISIL